MSSVTAQPYFQRSVAWKGTQDPKMPWTAQVDGDEWVLRLGEFPDEDMYGLRSTARRWLPSTTGHRHGEGRGLSRGGGQPGAQVTSPTLDALKKRVASLERRVGALSKEVHPVRGGRAIVKINGRKAKTPKASRSGR